MDTLTPNQEHYPQIPANHFRWTHASLTDQITGISHRSAPQELKHHKKKNKKYKYEIAYARKFEKF